MHVAYVALSFSTHNISIIVTGPVKTGHICTNYTCLKMALILIIVYHHQNRSLTASNPSVGCRHFDNPLKKFSFTSAGKDVI